MFKVLLSGAAAVAMAAGSAMAAPSVSTASPDPGGSAWMVTPAEATCHTDVELVGRSGAAVQVALVSDGRAVELGFRKAEIPERAFLPIRINQKAYSNLVVRAGGAEQGGRMLLSDETLNALRKGGSLQIGWLADEPVSASLLGSDQGVFDLRTCGSQVAARYAERQAAAADAKARSDAEAHARQVAEEQLAVVRAQREAAEAERTRLAAEAQHQQAMVEVERQRAYDSEQQRLAYEAQRREREWQDLERQRAYEEEARWARPRYAAPGYVPPQYSPPGRGYGWRPRYGY